MSITLEEPQKELLVNFLIRRGLNNRCTEMLQRAFNENDLKRGDLSTNKNLTYAKILKEIVKGINNGWINESDFASILDNAEIAGKQHICLFCLPGDEKDRKSIFNAIKSPGKLAIKEIALKDFYSVPEDSYARVIENTEETILIKIVCKRSYWDREYDLKDPTEEIIHRWKRMERSAVILKCSIDDGILQIRVPPREGGTGETAKTVYEFFISALSNHYNLKKNSWINKVSPFQVTEAYNSLLENREDFCLKYDTPESDTASNRMTRKGSSKDHDDLRDDPMWDYGENFSRNTIKGTWTTDRNTQVFSHLNYDEFRTGQNSTVKLSRVYLPKYVLEEEVEYVISRLSEHI